MSEPNQLSVVASHSPRSVPCARHAGRGSSPRGILLVVVAAVIAAVLAYGLSGSEASVVVSPETTLLTEPLAADGLPDYAGHALPPGSSESETPGR